MNFSSIGRNLLNKSPKIALILLILYALAHHSGRVLGVATHPEKNTQTQSLNPDLVSGYGGVVPVELRFGDDGLLDTVVLAPNNETRAYIRRLERAKLLDSWDSMTIAEVQMSDVEAVSGATLSSKAIIANVKIEAARLGSSKVQQINEFDTIWWVRQAAVWAVMILALLAYCNVIGRRWRWVLLVSSVGVLGFWQGSMLSLQYIYNLAVGGSSWLYITMLLVLALAVLIPLMFNRAFYCMYLCPFGAAQELMAKIPARKVTIPPSMLTASRWVKRAILVAFVGLLWADATFDLAQWEPFSAFVDWSTISVLTIAVVSLVASIFAPKAWCRLLCPTGEMLQLMQRKIKRRR